MLSATVAGSDTCRGVKVTTCTLNSMSGTQPCACAHSKALHESRVPTQEQVCASLHLAVLSLCVQTWCACKQ